MKQRVGLSGLLLLGSSGYALPQNSLPTDQPGSAPAALIPPSVSTATSHKKRPVQNPADLSAQRQSGLTNAQARSLLELAPSQVGNRLCVRPDEVGQWSDSRWLSGRRIVAN